MKSSENCKDTWNDVGVVSIDLKAQKAELMEFGRQVYDTKAECCVLVAPGDVLSIAFTANNDTADVFDVYIDGILRQSQDNKRPTSKVFKGTVEKVFYQPKKANSEKRAGMKYCKMEVQKRDVSRDNLLGGPRSEVGSLVIKCWRKKADAPEVKDEDRTIDETIPTAEKYADWWDLNRNLAPDGSQPPTFQIKLTDPKDVQKSTRLRLEAVPKRQPGEYELFGTFVFLLRCTADLTALGYPAPVRNPPPPQEDVSSLFGEEPEKEEGKKEDPKVKKTQKKTGPEKIKKVKENKTVAVKDDPIQKKKSKDAPGPQQSIQGILNHMQSSKGHNPKMTGEVSATSEKEPIISGNKGVGQPHVELPEHSDRPEKRPVNEALSPSDGTPVAIGTTHPGVEIGPASLIKSKEVDDESNITRQVRPIAKKPLVLAGMPGGPAHLAFLERDSTQASESRHASPSHDGLEQLISDQLYNEASQALVSGAHDEPEGAIFQNHVSSEPVEPISPVTSRKSELTFDHIESPNFEPLTPPASARKQAGFSTIQVLVTPNRPSSFIRASSELSDASTEIAEPEEIEAAVRSSQCISDGAAHHTIESPILGERSLSSSFKEDAQSEVNPQILVQQARMSWLIQSNSSSISNSPSLTPKVSEQIVSEPLSTNGDQNGSQPILPDPNPAPKLIENPKPMEPTLKRNADAINGQENKKQGPRKTAVAPALRKTDEQKRKKEAAQARFEAAKQREAELQQMKLQIEEIERENNEIKKLEEEAERAERQNAELEAEVDAKLAAMHGGE